MPIVPIVILVLGVVAVGVACEVARRRAFRPIAERPSAGPEWRRHFPAASDADVREFLMLFEDAFVVGREHALKFRPDDRIMDIYRAVNPPKWTMADQMEIEIFGLTLKPRYGVALDAIWRDDLTLGEVFRATRSA
jgi:propanediol dehydratase small subunit